jgi:acyl carrier protein
MEMNADFDNKILEIIAGAVPGKFKKTRIVPETHLQKELGLDSIGVLSLVFMFEEAFSIDIAQSGVKVDIAKLRTVRDVLDAGRQVMSKTLV